MKKKIGKFLSYIFAFSALIITIFPLIITIFCSFKDNDGITFSMFSFPKVFHFENYVAAIERAGILRAVFNSILLAVLTTIVVEVDRKSVV